MRAARPDGLPRSSPGYRPCRSSASEERAAGGRSARKRRAIIEAATALFLEHGYQGTSMNDIAALAAVSKHRQRYGTRMCGRALAGEPSPLAVS